MIRQTSAVFFLCLACSLMPDFALADKHEAENGPAEVAERFSQALKAGDEATVRAVLDPAVLIFESGSVEASLEEYAAHHLGADMAFMADMENEILSRVVFEDGDITVLSTRYQMHGSYDGQVYQRVSSETLVLKKSANGWKIVHIHWS